MLKNRQLRQNSSVTSSAIVKTESSVNEANQPISAIGLMVAGNSGGKRQECQEPDCQYAAVTSKAIKIHAYNYHKLFTCEICGEQILGVNDIRRHVIKNHKAELCCPYCSRAYSAKAQLNEHKRKCDKKKAFGNFGNFGNRFAATPVNKKQQDSAYKMSATSSGNSQVSSSTGKKPQPQYMPEDLIRPMLEYIRDHSNYPAYKTANKLGDDGYRIVFDKWDRLCAMLNSSYSHSGYVATPTKLMTKWKNLKERVRKRHLITRTNPDVRLPKRIILDRNESLVAELLGGWQNDSFDGGDSGMLTIPIENNPFFSAMKQKTVPMKSNDRKVNEEFRLL